MSAGCPGSRVFRDPGEASVRENGRLEKLQLQHTPLVHPDQSPLLEGIRAKASPRPKLRRFHETTPYGIAMYIAKFLHTFCRRTDVEVIAVMENKGEWFIGTESQVSNSARPGAPG